MPPTSKGNATAPNIWVRTPWHQTLAVPLSAATSTATLAAAVAARTDLKPHELHLHWGGKPLASSAEGPVALADYGVGAGATVELLLRIPGGAKLGKEVKGKAREKEVDQSLAAKLRWLQEQAERRTRAKDIINAARARAEGEAAASRINNMKIMESMRQLMRSEKLQGLRRDLEALSTAHQQGVMRRDAELERLLQALTFADHQHEAAAQSHMQHTEDLIRMQDQRLLLAERQFEADMQTLVQEFGDERSEVFATQRLEVEDQGVLASGIADEESKDADHALAELHTIKQECREKRDDGIDDLRTILDGRLEVIQDAFQTAHLNYLERTDKRVADFKHHTKVNREREKDIERCVRQIERYQTQIAEVRSNMTLSSRKFERQRVLLEKEKGELHDQVTEIRDKMRRFRMGQDKRVLTLATQAESSNETLKGRLEHAENILALAELARKKETEKEKVLPFQILAEETNKLEASIRAAAEEEMGATAAVKGDSVGLSGAAKAPSATNKHPLHNFHSKFNNALSEKLLVERERDRLRLENTQLTGMLKQIQDGMIVNDEILADQTNSLFRVTHIESKVLIPAGTMPQETLPVRRMGEPKQQAVTIKSATGGRATGGMSSVRIQMPG